MKQVAALLAVGLSAWWVCPVAAEPAWTRDGNCTTCHMAQYTGLLAVFGHDGTATPSHHGEFKVFRAPRGQTKSLMVGVGGLAAGDRYAFGLKGLRYGGLTTGATLSYGADCDWADWGGAPGTFTYNEFYLNWGTDPAMASYDITVGAAAVYDYYELICFAAGRSSSGELFYAEEHVYLQVRPPNTPPIVAISSPANGAVFAPAPIDVPVAANASDPGGSVIKVEFFADGNKIGEDATAPYNCTWAGAGKGAHSLTARATDNDGATTTSSPIQITVKGVPGDFDNDSDVDQSDFGYLQTCLAGNLGVPAGCEDADLNGDNQVNNTDASIFVGCMSGAKVQGDPACLN
jgi:hypothetical protein